MITVEERNSIDELAELRDAWRTLHEQTADASIFQTLDWLEIYWQHFAADQNLRVIIVRESDRPVGIVPMVVRSVRTGVGSLRYLTYPLDEWAVTFGPITARPAETLAAAFKHIAHTPRDSDVLEPRWVSAADHDAAHTADALAAAGYTSVVRPWIDGPEVNLAGTFDDYIASKNSRWRNKMKRTLRNVEKLGAVEFVRHRPQGERHGDCDPNWEMYGHCEQIAERSWQGDSETGTTISHAPIRPFLRDVHAMAARLGMCDICMLYVGGHPAAFSYGYCVHGRAYGLRTGYDARSGYRGSGTALFWHLIEDSYCRGDKAFDMGQGASEWKRAWQTSVQPTYRYTHFASPRARLLRMNVWAKSRLRGLGRLTSAIRSQASM